MWNLSRNCFTLKQNDQWFDCHKGNDRKCICTFIFFKPLRFHPVFQERCVVVVFVLFLNHLSCLLPRLFLWQVLHSEHVTDGFQRKVKWRNEAGFLKDHDLCTSGRASPDPVADPRGRLSTQTLGFRVRCRVVVLLVLSLAQISSTLLPPPHPLPSLHHCRLMFLLNLHCVANFAMLCNP